MINFTIMRCAEVHNAKKVKNQWALKKEYSLTNQDGNEQCDCVPGC